MDADWASIGVGIVGVFILCGCLFVAAQARLRLEMLFGWKHLEKRREECVKQALDADRDEKIAAMEREIAVLAQSRRDLFDYLVTLETTLESLKK